MKTVLHLERQIIRKVGKAIGDFSLIEDGDNIILALSGGKDSWTLLHTLKHLQRKAPVHFELSAVTVDPGFPGFDTEIIKRYMRQQHSDIPYLLYASNIYQIIVDKKTPGKSFCSFCARLRRGVLYRLAGERGCNKIALAHTADDVIETLLLNQFFAGKIKAMAPKLHADNGMHTVIRPLCYVEEHIVRQFVSRMDFPVVDGRCVAWQEKEMQRAKIKQLLAELEGEYPGLKSTLLHSLSRIEGRHLMDKRFWDDEKYR